MGVQNGDAYEISATEKAPYLDLAGTIQAENGVVSLFILNRDLVKPRHLELNWEDKPAAKLVTSLVLTGTDLKASNDFGSPNRVVPKEAEKPVASGGRTMVEVPPRSYSVFQWQG